MMRLLYFCAACLFFMAARCFLFAVKKRCPLKNYKKNFFFVIPCKILKKWSIGSSGFLLLLSSILIKRNKIIIIISPSSIFDFAPNFLIYTLSTFHNSFYCNELLALLLFNTKRTTTTTIFPYYPPLKLHRFVYVPFSSCVCILCLFLVYNCVMTFTHIISLHQYNST